MAPPALRSYISFISIALVFTLMMTQPAFAHVSEEGLKGGFISGYIHPLLGWDHVAAMVAVGIWGAFLGRRAIWLLPIVFPFIMVIGGILGMVGVPIPFIVPGIALSSIIIGLAIVFKWRAALWTASIIAGAFAVFHGYAHGQNLPAASNPIAFALGFVLGSGTLHLIGILFSLVERYKWGIKALQLGGVIIALIGVAVLVMA